MSFIPSLSHPQGNEGGMLDVLLLNVWKTDFHFKHFDTTSVFSNELITTIKEIKLWSLILLCGFNYMKSVCIQDTLDIRKKFLRLIAFFV